MAEEAIRDLEADAPPRRPWWFIPAALGVVVGSVAGFVLLPAPLPPCSPPGASSDVVIRRFLERLGGPPAAIADCWGRGWLPPEALAQYAAVTPPAGVTFDRVAPGQGEVLDPPDGREHLTWELTVDDGTSPLFRCPAPARFGIIVMREDDGRWLIQATTCVMPRP